MNVQDGRPVNEWTTPQITGLESIQINAPRPAAHIRAAVYVRYNEETPEHKRDDLERVLLFGGWEHVNSYRSGSTSERGTWIYTPTENSWFNISMKKQPRDRIGHSLTSLCGDVVVLYGGILNEDLLGKNDLRNWTFSIRNFRRPVSHDPLWIFDGVRELWENHTLSPAPTHRAFHSAVAFRSTITSGCNTCHCRQSVFIFGGLTRLDSTGVSKLLDDLWELTVVRKDGRNLVFRWKQHAKMDNTWPMGRFLHFAVTTGDNKMMIFGGKLQQNNSAYVDCTSILTWNRRGWIESNSRPLNPYMYQQVSNNVLSPNRFTAALVSDESQSQRRIIQIQNGHIYTFSKPLNSWVRNKTAIGKSTPTSLRDFAAVMVNGKITVFSGIVSQLAFRILSVWNVESIDNIWIWQLLYVPRNTPRLQAFASWNAINNKLVFTSSTSHQWSKFLLYRWSRLADFISTVTKKVFDALIGCNDTSSIEAANRVRVFTDQIYSYYVGLNRSSNSVWQMDLDTSTWWQYATASGNRPLFITSTTGLLLDESHTLVTYGGSSVSEFPNEDSQLRSNISLFSFALNRSDIFVYSLDRRVWVKPKRLGTLEPIPRLLPAMAQGIDGRSVFFFGGLSLNVSAIENAVDFSSPNILNLILNMFFKRNPRCENEVWKLTFLVATLDDIKMRWERLTNKTCRRSEAPTGRVNHIAVMVDNFLVIWGGILTSVSVKNGPKLLECSKDLWIFNISNYRWKKVLPENTDAMFRSSEATYHMHCTSPVAVMGKRLIAAGDFNATYNSKRNLLGLWSITINSSDVDFHYLNYTIPLSPEYMFTWKSRILAVKQEPGDDFSKTTSEIKLDLQYRDNVYVTEIEPGCLAGHFSPDWSTTNCQECGVGRFAVNGWKTCEPCLKGSTTFVHNASSLKDCICDPDYCVHGRCLLVHGLDQKQLAIECQCDFGFTGERCHMPTYFIIGGVSIPTFIIVFFALVFLRKMIKYRKQKFDSEVKWNELNRVWTISCSEIYLFERIDGGALGSYGHVYKARYRDMTVALKKLKLRTKEIEREFQRETELMKSMRHENIVLFIGAGKFDLDDCPYLVVEYMQNGALTNIIRNPAIMLTSCQQLKFCLDAARGMAYLHSQRPPRIHRDLKSSNLLVSASWVVKVADFGCARLVKKAGARFPVANRRPSPSSSLDEVMEPLLTTEGDLSDEVGAALWRAPEIFASEAYGTSADVYR